MAVSVSEILAPGGASATGQPFTRTITGSAAAGDFVFAVTVSSGVGTYNAPTDSAGNTWVHISQGAIGSNGRYSLAGAKVTKPIIGGTTTFSVNTGGTSFKGSSMFVVTPQEAGLVMIQDRSANTSSQTTATPVTGSSGTLATDYELAIAVYGWASNDTFTEPAGWTNPHSTGVHIATTTTVVSAAGVVLLPTAKTALNPSATLGASVSSGGTVVTFRITNDFSYTPVRLATPFVGPATLRRLFRPPQIPQYYSTVAAAGTTLTPDPASLILTTFAPAVTTTANQTVTPNTASLVLTGFAPTVTASDNKTVTPGTATLTLTTFAPTVTVAVNISVTPGTANLTLSTFAPTISVSDNQTVTPGTLALSTSTFAPTVTATNNITVTPGVYNMVLTMFSPSVSVGGDVVVTPATAALVLTTYAPAGGASGGTGGGAAPSLIFDTEGRPMVKLSNNMYMPL